MEKIQNKIKIERTLTVYGYRKMNQIFPKNISVRSSKEAVFNSIET